MLNSAGASFLGSPPSELRSLQPQTSPLLPFFSLLSRGVQPGGVEAPELWGGGTILIFMCVRGRGGPEDHGCEPQVKKHGQEKRLSPLRGGGLVKSLYIMDLILGGTPPGRKWRSRSSQWSVGNLLVRRPATVTTSGARRQRKCPQLWTDQSTGTRAWPLDTCRIGPSKVRYEWW